MKRHFWQYLLSSSGAPIDNARIHVFLSDQVTESEIRSSDITNNIFIDISNDAYVYIGVTEGEPVNSYNKTNTSGGKITTNNLGFFDFWVSDIETNYSSYAYNYEQKFTIAWVGDGIDVGVVENIDIFGIHHEADKNDKTSSVAENQNKLISNKFAANLDDHLNKSVDTANPHDLSAVDESANPAESDYTEKTKMVSNELAVQWNDHVNDDAVNGGDVHNQYLRRDASLDMTSTVVIVDLNADLLDGEEGQSYKDYADNAVSSHSSNTSSIHGISGNAVGTSDNQTLTNKTLDSLNSPIDIDDGGTGAVSAIGARANLGLGTAAISDDVDFVQTTISTPVGAGGSQDIQSSLVFIDDADSMTLDIDAEYGSIGFFGTTAPSAQDTVSDLSTYTDIISGGYTFTDVASGGDTLNLGDLNNVIQGIYNKLVDVGDLNNEVQALHTKLNTLLDALQKSGIIGE